MSPNIPAFANPEAIGSVIDADCDFTPEHRDRLAAQLARLTLRDVVTRLLDQIVDDDHFGVCPQCGTNDGHVNAGKAHWFVCHQHRTCWGAGSNLFSSWKHETQAEQRHAHDVDPGWGAYREIAPWDAKIA